MDTSLNPVPVPQLATIPEVGIPTPRALSPTPGDACPTPDASNGLGEWLAAFAPMPPQASGPNPVDSCTAKPRFQRPERGQLLLLPTNLDKLIPEDHEARIVWEYVQSLDLSSLYDQIQAVENHPGRSPIDPRILMALWLYATIDGQGSARKIAQLCLEHNAYRWICGGVAVNYHTLSDFRTAHVELLDRLLTHSVATLREQGLVELTQVSQDGLRVRAAAGASSFHRRPTLEAALREAQERVQTLRAELEADPAGATRRQAAAQKRAARERQERLHEALKHMEELEAKKGKSQNQAEGSTSAPEAPALEETATTKSKKEKEPRASSTDPEARVMKMPDGGFRPAFNFQFASTTSNQVIVGVSVSNSGGDNGQLAPMHEQIQERHEEKPEAILVDAGYSKKEDIETVMGQGTKVITPVQKAKKADQDPHQPRPQDSPAIAEWRQYMGTAEAKETYKKRSLAEWINAMARRYGLSRLLVRGLEKVKAVGLWFALALNLRQAVRLRAQAAEAPKAGSSG